jgi:hypothetical protein
MRATITEWLEAIRVFEDLDERTIKEEAISNHLNLDCTISLPVESVTSRSDALSFAFAWSVSRRGHRFWLELKRLNQ